VKDNSNMSNPWFERRTRCPACSSDNFAAIYQAKYDEGPVKDYLENFYSHQGGVEFAYLKDAQYILCECDDCDLIFQKDIPNNFLLTRIYDHWIDPHIARAQHKKNINSYTYYSNIAKEILRIINHFGKPPSELSLLDFGMGWGKWSLMAKSFGCESYGTELSVERINYAKNNGIKIINFEDSSQHKFDFINTEQVFEHLSHPLETLTQLQAALKPDGVIKISVPGSKDIHRRLKVMDWNFKQGSRYSLNPVAPLEHINCYGKMSILKMASEVGMEEVAIPKLAFIYSNDWRKPKKNANFIISIVYRHLTKGKNCVFLKQM